jgi:hypothetical protein
MREWFRWIGVELRDWKGSFPYCPSVEHIILSSVKLYVVSLG